jgi:murein DD-endopeptidase MepM/ murein hydrolase activator NlpD
VASEYRLPFDNPDTADGFGSMTGRAHPHRGVDFPQPVGARIRAVAAGTVISIGFDSVLGWVTVLRHTRPAAERLRGLKPVYSGYCHQDAPKLSLHVGQAISLGDLIGYVGRTGEVTGPHLHLTMSHDPRGVFRGEVFDPLKFIARYPERPKAARFVTVPKGSNLTRLAAKYETTVTQLVKLNGIADPNLIRAGAKLRVK